MAEGQVLLITGASSGIGASTARLAVEQGWRVVLGARSEDKLGELAASLGGDEHAIARRCDVTDWDDQEALVGAAVDHFGRLDASFANAGFGAKRGFLEETPEQWRAMVLTNVYGAALSIRAALAHFKEQNTGHFVLTGSVAGRRALPGSLYSSTKWAISGMAESLRQEVADTPLRVTVVEPGVVDTPFFDNPVSDALEARDIAEIVMFALTRPGRVDLNEVLVRPVNQPI